MATQLKREFSRMVCRDAVRLMSSKGVEYATYEDLSAGGLRIRMNRAAEFGELMEISFSLRRSTGQRVREIKTMVRVVRCEKESSDAYGVGVQFLDLQDSTRSAIQSSIDSSWGPF